MESISAIGANIINPFIPFANHINAFWGVIKVVPHIPSLLNFFNQAPPEMQELMTAFNNLTKAQKDNDFGGFKKASAEITEAINVMQMSQDKKQIFKKYPHTGAWMTYLSPLTNLKNELEKFQVEMLGSADRGPLNAALVEALNFINREVSGQDGLLVSGLHKTIAVVKQLMTNGVKDVLGLQQETVSVAPEKSPLMKLLDDLKEFKFQGPSNHEDYIKGVLSEDLFKLDEKGTFFEGINDFVKTKVDDKKPYANQVCVLIMKFSLEGLKKTRSHIFYQEVYKAAVRNRSIKHEDTTETKSDQIEWGKRKLDNLDESSQHTLTILEAIAATTEIERFDKLIRNSKAKVKNIYPNAGKLLEELQKHPLMKLHPSFNEKMSSLIRNYINAASFKRGIDVNQAHKENHKKNFLNALAELRNAIRPTVVKEDSQISQAAMGAINTLRPFVPAQVLDPIAHTIQIGAQSVKSFLGAQSGEKIESFPLPLMSLYGKIHDFREQYSDSRYARFVQDELDQELRRIEIAYPNFFKGLTHHVRSERVKNKELLVINIDCYVTEFILSKVEKNDQFFQALYHGAVKHGMIRESLRKDPNLQIEWGKAFLQDRDSNMRHDVLWEAVGFSLEIKKLGTLIETLEYSEADDEADISQKVDILLAYIENNPHIQGSQELLHTTCLMVIPLFQSLMDFKGGLSKEEQREVNRQFLAAMETLGENPTASDAAKALKILKTLFDTGPLAPMVGVISKSDSPSSAVATLSTAFETGKTHMSGKVTPKVDKDEIAREERKFAHNLSMIGTFKVMSQYCKLDPKTSEEKFEAILKKVEEIEYNGSGDQIQNKRKREEIFKKELEKMMADSTRVYVPLLNWIVFKLVKHFTSAFSKALIQNAQTVLLNPANNPLKGHHGVIKGINNGFLALLFSERVWRSDTKGELGVNEKEETLLKIISGFSGNLSQEGLIEKVVEKALNEFPIGTFSNNRVLNGIATFFVKGIGRLIVKRMDLAKTVLDTMSDTIYSKKHVNYNVDALILKQLEEFEKILGEESGELLINEGDNGKRLVKQLVDNFFALLKERGVMTPELLQNKKQSILGQLDGAIGGATDSIIKSILQNLLLFGLETFKEEERMNQTILDALKLGNRSLRLNTESLLRELYNDEPNLDSLSQNQLIARFQEEHSCATQGVVTRKEYETALQIKHANTEKKLHKVLGRILDKTIKNVVETQVDKHLKPPREAVLEYIQWLQHQFNPYRAHLDKEESYVEEMKKLCSPAQKGNAKAIAEIEERHKKLLIQLKNKLNLLKLKEGEEPSKTNLQIKRLYHATERLVKALEEVNSALIEGKYGTAHNRLRALEKKMKEIEPTLMGIQFTLATENLSISERVVEMAASAGRKGAELATPLIRTYLNRRLSTLAEEAISMYKSRAVFKAMTEQVVFRSYMEYQPSSDKGSGEQTVAEHLLHGWENVPLDSSSSRSSQSETREKASSYGEPSQFASSDFNYDAW